MSGAGLMVATMDGIADGALVAVPQPADGVSLAPKVTVDDARVDWTAPGRHVDRLVRACTPVARRLDDVPRRAAQARPGPAARHQRARTGRARRGEVGGGRRDVDARRRARHRCNRPARNRWRPPTGPAAPGSNRASALTERRPRPAGRVDPARVVAFELLRAVDEKGAYANLLLPKLIGERRLAHRDAGLATELGYGTLRSLGTLDEILAALRRPDARRRRAGRARPAPARRLPGAAHPHPAARRRRHDRRPRAGRRVTAGPAASSTRSCAAWSARTGTPGWPSSPPAPRRCGRWPCSTAHPEWVVDAFAAALGGDLAETEAALRADDERPPHPSGGLAGPDQPRPTCSPRSTATPARTRPTRCGCPAATRPGSTRSAGAGPPSRTRAASCAPSPSRPRRWTARTSAGSTSAPARAARPRCWPRSPPGAAPPCTPTSAARTAPNSSGGPPSRGASRSPSATPASCPVRRAATTGCCSTRRAPGWARCAAARRCAGGAAPTTCRNWSRCSASCSAPRCG